jgi:uncharacterized membrane protein YhaH (DUF805 family)
MRGTLLDINKTQRTGIISTPEGRYNFIFEEVKSPIEELQAGAEVDFIVEDDKAKEIYITELPAQSNIPYYEDQPNNFASLFSAKGCYTRWQYWKIILITTAILLIYAVTIGFIAAGVDNGEYSETALGVVGIIGFLLFVPILYISIVTSIKRFHDINLSGWFYLLNFIPYIGGLITFIMNGFLPSVKEGNRFCRRKN